MRPFSRSLSTVPRRLLTQLSEGSYSDHVAADDEYPEGDDSPRLVEDSPGSLRLWVWIVGLAVPGLFVFATVIRHIGGVGHAGGVDWNAVGDSAWETLMGLGQLGPFGTAIAAIIAALALSQKWKADERTAWWSRVAWAADHSLSEDDDVQLIGISALSAIRAGSPPSAADTKLLEAIGQRTKRDEIDQLTPEQDTGRSAADAD